MLLTSYTTLRPKVFPVRTHCCSFSTRLFWVQPCAGCSDMNKGRLPALGASGWNDLPGQFSATGLYAQAKPPRCDGVCVDGTAYVPTSRPLLVFPSACSDRSSPSEHTLTPKAREPLRMPGARRFSHLTQISPLYMVNPSSSRPGVVHVSPIGLRAP